VDQVAVVALVQLQLELMVETEFHFQAEPLPEFMEAVVVVGVVALPVALVAVERLYRETMKVLVQIEQMELMVKRIPEVEAVLQNGVALA
jgi:hypothetical protein